MKKVIAIVLALSICLSLCACGNSNACSCDCAQCAHCEKKTQNTVAAEADQVDYISEKAEQNDNVIKFETSIVVAEDENLRVELVKFYQEHRLWKQGYPYASDSTAEGATQEKIVVFKFCNKTNHTLNVAMSDAYLGNDGAKIFNVGSGYADDVAAGKNILKDFLILTAEEETLESIEELYSLDGDFTVWHKGEDGVLRKKYELKFSIPNALDGENGSVSPVSEATSIYYGKWQVTDVKIAGENTSDENDATIEEILKGILDVLDDTYFVFAESGDCCYYTGNGTTLGKWNVTETGVTAGTNVWVAEGNQLVCERDGFLLYWEKVSDSQAFPET